MINLILCESMGLSITSELEFCGRNGLILCCNVVKTGLLGRAGSQVVRAHATIAVDPSSNPAGGPVLHVTPPSLSPF